jgi:hypothetical protein
MALEDLTGTSKFIDDFINTNPAGTDPKNQGDDHIRGIKNVLLNTFPNIDAAVTSNPTELNLLDGRSLAGSGNVIDNFATGTLLIFPQAAAPTGYTQNVTYTNHMLRVVDTAGGATGGTDSPILNDKVPSHNHTFTTASGGTHTHTVNGGNGATSDTGSITFRSQTTNETRTSNSAGAHTHTGTTNANGSASSWTPKYIDTIVCSKDAP